LLFSSTYRIERKPRCREKSLSCYLEMPIRQLKLAQGGGIAKPVEAA
jgi:hypothetical protein